MNWADEFKVALAVGNEKKLTELCDNVPTFGSVEDMKIASDLLGEARGFFEKKREICAKEMEFLKKSKNFVSGDRSRSYSKIDITS